MGILKTFKMYSQAVVEQIQIVDQLAIQGNMMHKSRLKNGCCVDRKCINSGSVTNKCDCGVCIEYLYTPYRFW